jgi:dipeptidase E
MATYIQLSGFDKNGFFETVASELRKAIHDTNNILFVASTPDGYEKNDDYSTRIFRWFHESGICFKNYNTLDKRVSDDDQKRLMRNASCVFLMGGQTKIQLEYLTMQELVPLVKRHNGVIIGLSAGAINMSKRSVIANPSHPPVSIHSGIGLVDTTVVPHFGGLSDLFIGSKILPMTLNEPIYGLYDDAVIVNENETIKHSGTIYKLLDNKIISLSYDDPL